MPAPRRPSTATSTCRTEAKIKKELVARGMQITDPANGEKEWIAKTTAAVWPKFYASIGGKEKLDRVQKVLGR